jgi:hypothetical protein
VFVLGMPRTGTTLLERILGGNPQVTLCGELNDFRMQFKWASDHHCSGLPRRRRRGPHRRRGLRRARRALPRARALARAGHALVQRQEPGNFQLAGLIARALPQARIVHLRRNPMDSCFSNLKELFAANAHPYSYCVRATWRRTTATTAG